MGILIAAVVVVAALPIFIYALDEDASEDQWDRYRGPSMRVDGEAGAMNVAGTWAPAGSLRLTGNWFFAGAEALTEGSTDLSYSRLEASVLLRPPPRYHVDGALAVGAGELTYAGATHTGATIALPHRYLLRPSDSAEVDLELRPGVLIHSGGADWSLEGGVSVPIGRVFSVEARGRVYSFGSDLAGATSAGVSVHL